MFFDEGVHPANVTFDDGESSRRNLPWSHFRCADWDYTDPTAIHVEIGDWQVVISDLILNRSSERLKSLASRACERIPISLTTRRTRPTFSRPASDSFISRPRRRSVDARRNFDSRSKTPFRHIREQQKRKEKS